jgi:hypothetical protein
MRIQWDNLECLLTLSSSMMFFSSRRQILIRAGTTHFSDQMDRPGSFFTNEELFKADFAKSASE